MNFFRLNVLIIPILFAISFFVQAQNQYEDNTYSEHSVVRVSTKVVSKMEQLKSSKFMQSYRTMQIEIEETIKMVKSNEHLYDSQDIYEIKVAYRITANEFNKVLGELKRDLLKGKYKTKNSVYFNRNLEQQHHLLTKFYQTNFKKPIAVILEGKMVMIE
ncbi:MAG: hypothetical protein ACPG49_07370 [Chitinophagales bacterium]